jgi:hypothetical protein
MPDRSKKPPTHHVSEADVAPVAFAGALVRAARTDASSVRARAPKKIHARRKPPRIPRGTEVADLEPSAPVDLDETGD